MLWESSGSLGSPFGAVFSLPALRSARTPPFIWQIAEQRCNRVSFRALALSFWAKRRISFWPLRVNFARNLALKLTNWSSFSALY